MVSRTQRSSDQLWVITCACPHEIEIKLILQTKYQGSSAGVDANLSSSYYHIPYGSTLTGNKVDIKPCKTYYNTVVCHQSSSRHLMRIRTVRLRNSHVLQSARHCPRTCRPPPRLPPPLWARSSHYPPHSLSTAASLLTSSARRTSRRAISSSASFSAG